MIVPNTERVIIKRISSKQYEQKVIIPGQLKAGENLYVGEVIHAGDTKFKKGQVVYYSEYSASALYDMGAVMRKEKSVGDITKEEEVMFVVAEDDILAYEKNDTKKV